MWKESRSEAGDQLNSTARAVLGIAGLTIAMSMPPASAAEKLRTSKAAPEAFSFTPLDIGMRKGLFAKHGIEVESIAFAGDARRQQMMATDSLDIALGSGPHHGVHRQGVPIKATAAMASHSRAPRLNLRLGRAGDGRWP
jgi:ABC-type nitrate/sulfonate/bicarbonate transport system substrate-binding protein